MATFGKRLHDQLEYLFHGFGTDKDLYQAAAVALEVDAQAIKKWCLNKRGPRTVWYLFDLADKLGVSLDWLSGKPTDQRWSVDVIQARQWLRRQVHSVQVPTYAHRTFAIIDLLATRLPNARRDWFIAGVLGITLDDYLFNRHAGIDAMIGHESLVQFAAFADLPVEWLKHGFPPETRPAAVSEPSDGSSN